MIAQLSSLFGLVALALASIGLYGVTACGQYGGSACESNTPSSVRTATGFEDREDHRTLSTSSARKLCELKLHGYDANGTQLKKGEFRSTGFYHRVPDTASESCWMREGPRLDLWQ
jgi:hypothetical protein